MDPVEVQIAIAVASILGSGVVSGAVSHRFTVSRADREFRRAKAEALFLALHGYCKLIFSRNVVWPRVMKRELSYDEALDINNRNFKDKDYAHHENAEMLISLYFPVLKRDWAEILGCRDDINRILSKLKELYLAQGDTDSLIPGFSEVMLSLGRHEEVIKGHLAKLTRAI